MIVLITGWFDVRDKYGYPTGEKEFGTSHGVDMNTGKTIITSNDSPDKLGAKYNREMMEWVIED